MDVNYRGKISREQMHHIFKLDEECQERLGWESLKFINGVKKEYGVRSLTKLDQDDYEQIVYNFGYIK